MSIRVNVSDHDCTFGLNRGRPDSVVETKKFTLGELGHIWPGSLKARSLGFERLLWLRCV